MEEAAGSLDLSPAAMLRIDVPLLPIMTQVGGEGEWRVFLCIAIMYRYASTVPLLPIMTQVGRGRMQWVGSFP